MIHLIATSANISDQYHLRKSQYLQGLASIKTHYGVTPIIIETVQATDYLNEDFVGHSRYCHHAGNNEFSNIQEFMTRNPNHFNSDDDIIKMTMRYEITGSDFIDTIRAHPEYDGYCKRSRDIYGPNDPGVHTFLFSMKYRCWQEFLASDLSVNRNSNDPIEWRVCRYLEKKNTLFVDKLAMRARPWAHRGREYPV